MELGRGPAISEAELWVVVLAGLVSRECTREQRPAPC
jgi:hypothetical protein